MVAGAVTDTDSQHRTAAGAQQIFGRVGKHWGSERRVRVPASCFPSETVMLDGASRPGAPAAAPGERVPPVSTRTRCGWVCDISVGKAEVRLVQERVPPPDTPKWLLPRDARRPAFLIRAGFVSSRFSFSAVLPVSPSAGIQTFITSCVRGKAGAELGMGRGLWGLSAHYAVFLQVNIQHLRARQWRGVGRRPSGEAGCPFIAVPFIRAPSTAAAQGGTGAAPRPT